MPGKTGARIREGLAVVRGDLFRAPVQPMPAMRRPRALRWLPHGVVVFFALVLMTGSSSLADDYRLSTGLAVMLAFAQTASVGLALYRPVLAWWASLATFLFTAEATFPPPDTDSLWPWMIAALFGHAAVQLLLALRVRPRVAAETLGLSLAVTALVEWQGMRHDYARSFGFAVVLFAVAAVVGAALRGRREARTQLAAQETATAEERARRTLLEERSRIARELHDVVAHHMSVISIQAEAAPYRVPDPPEELTRSFGVIRENAVEALTELRRVLGVLRAGEPGAGPRDASVDAPQPSLARLDDLLTNVRRAGLDARAEVTGEPLPLPQGVELSAYRIVQEALSNVLRHAPGARARVHITHRPEGVDLRIRNTAPIRTPEPSPGAGHGLLGMRERAAMLGGHLTAGPAADGGFEVAAHLPRADPHADPHDEAHEDDEGGAAA
jgi:signal transduction histidine kinase